MYIESNVIELKEQLVDDVKKEIVAFLNTDGGTIYVGVKDDGTVVPFTSQKEKDSQRKYRYHRSRAVYVGKLLLL